jgi:hypothetical protein
MSASTGLYTVAKRVSNIARRQSFRAGGYHRAPCVRKTSWSSQGRSRRSSAAAATPSAGYARDCLDSADTAAFSLLGDPPGGRFRHRLRVPRVLDCPNPAALCTYVPCALSSSHDRIASARPDGARWIAPPSFASRTADQPVRQISRSISSSRLAWYRDAACVGEKASIEQ